MSAAPVLDDKLAALQKRFFGVGLIGAIAAVGAVLWDAEALLQSYLTAYVFWIAVPLGSFALLMLHHMVGGRWGFAIRRFLEAATRTFPLWALAFLPIWFGLEQIYPWAQGAEELGESKQVYLDREFFGLRTVFYFAAWIGFSMLLNRWSRQQDQGGTKALLRRLQLLSGPGLLLFGLTSTFSAIDWVMTIEVEWYSTIYGALFITGQGVSALTLGVLMFTFCRHHEPFNRLQLADRFHDLGNLLLAFVMLWAYMAFSQFLIMWSGDLPEEIPWYLSRSEGGWQYLALGITVFHLFLPLSLLLARRNKRRPERLAAIAALILAVRYLDVLWVVAPAFSPGHLRVHLFDLVTVVALGGLFGGFFLRTLRARPLIAIGDERFEAEPKLNGAPEHG